MILDKIMSDLSEEELEIGYKEIIELNETGVLSGGIIRNCGDLYKEKIPTFVFSISTIEKALLHEIAKRHYNNKPIKV